MISNTYLHWLLRTELGPKLAALKLTLSVSADTTRCSAFLAEDFPSVLLYAVKLNSEVGLVPGKVAI